MFKIIELFAVNSIDVEHRIFLYSFVLFCVRTISFSIFLFFFFFPEFSWRTLIVCEKFSLEMCVFFLNDLNNNSLVKVPRAFENIELFSNVNRSNEAKIRAYVEFLLQNE